ncbi:MAG: hypothetical protein ACRD22_16185, partial [Terriglobia bacterium]
TMESRRAEPAKRFPPDWPLAEAAAPIPPYQTTVSGPWIVCTRRRKRWVIPTFRSPHEKKTVQISYLLFVS